MLDPFAPRRPGLETPEEVLARRGWAPITPCPPNCTIDDVPVHHHHATAAGDLVHNRDTPRCHWVRWDAIRPHGPEQPKKTTRRKKT